MYLSKLILALILGVFVGKKLPQRVMSKASIVQTIILYLLLFFMGVNTGSIENILLELNTIGKQAFFITIFAMGGTIFVATIASFFLESNRHKIVRDDGLVNKSKGLVTSRDINKLYNVELSEEAKIQLKRHWFVKFIYVIREPVLLVMIVVVGMLLRLFTPAFNWFDQSLISYLLYALLFFSGLGVVNSNIKFKDIFDSPVLLLLPIWTIIGTYFGSFLFSMFSSFTVSESLGISSGFGWYSLSGIMITDLGYPILGSISFLSNIFRESFSFFLIPLLSKFGRRFYYPSICIGGATTMDITLPIITSHFGSDKMIPSIYHGLCITIVVPFLIPLFF